MYLYNVYTCTTSLYCVYTSAICTLILARYGQNILYYGGHRKSYGIVQTSLSDLFMLETGIVTVMPVYNMLYYPQYNLPKDTIVQFVHVSLVIGGLCSASQW